MPRINIRRDDQRFRDRFRSYKIVLDGATVGRVKRGEAVTIEADAGRHELHLEIDWARSPSVELDLADGQQRFIRCWSNVRPRQSSQYITAGRDQWIGIEVLPGGPSQLASLSE